MTYYVRRLATLQNTAALLAVKPFFYNELPTRSPHVALPGVQSGCAPIFLRGARRLRTTWMLYVMVWFRPLI